MVDYFCFSFQEEMVPMNCGDVFIRRERLSPAQARLLIGFKVKFCFSETERCLLAIMLRWLGSGLTPETVLRTKKVRLDFQKGLLVLKVNSRVRNSQDFLRKLQKGKCQFWLYRIFH